MKIIVLPHIKKITTRELGRWLIKAKTEVHSLIFYIELNLFSFFLCAMHISLYPKIR